MAGLNIGLSVCPRPHWPKVLLPHAYTSWSANSLITLLSNEVKITLLPNTVRITLLTMVARINLLPKVIRI